MLKGIVCTAVFILILYTYIKYNETIRLYCINNLEYITTNRIYVSPLLKEVEFNHDGIRYIPREYSVENRKGGVFPIDVKITNYKSKLN
jgi:hypothetical protein